MECKFMSVEEMAAMLGISLSSAYQMVHCNNFPALRIGRRVIIPYDKLLLWVDENLGLD